jgi:LPS sulfotransferase NodH
MQTEQQMRRMGIDHDAPEPTQPARHLLICCTPRSASATLSALLQASAGICDSSEYFSVPAEQRYNRRPDVTAMPVHRRRINPSYFHRILKLRTRQGVFSARVHETHLKRVIRAGLGHDLLDKAVLVYLRRRNLQDQAISYTVAQATEDWGRHEQPELNRENDIRKLKSAYVRNLQWLIHQNSKWQAIFSMLGKPVLEITTEDLAGNAEGAVLAVADHAGLKADPDSLRHEVLARPRYPAHAELKQRLKQHIADTIDPLDMIADRYQLPGKWRSVLANLLD